MADDLDPRLIVIQEENTPGILYHYASWKKDCNKKLITIPEVYLAGIESFDDPFDCGISLRYDLWSEEDCVAAWRQLIEKSSPKPQPSEIENELIIRKNEYRKDPKDFYKYVKENTDKSFKENIGIYCLSEIHYNMLMWSLYADKHKGICIGYNSEILERAVKSHFKTIINHPWVHFLKAQYEEDYPIIRPTTDMSHPQDFIKKLKTKFAQWSYQKEWRLTVGINRAFGEDERKIPIPPEAISEISLGLHMDEEDISCIISLLQKKKLGCKVFRMKQEEYSYRLLREEIVI